MQAVHLFGLLYFSKTNKQVHNHSTVLQLGLPTTVKVGRNSCKDKQNTPPKQFVSCHKTVRFTV